MTLTPVKVKGKGSRKKPWRPPSLSQKLKIKRGYGDPSDYATATRPASVQELREKRRLRRGRGTLVERLPVEIIERIFHFSENVNFPLSSLYIGWALSSPSFLTELIILAFGPTWDTWLGCAPEEVYSYTGWRTDVERFGGDPKFQSAVIACRWMKADLMLEAQRIWIRRHGRGRTYNILLPHLATAHIPLPVDTYNRPGEDLCMHQDDPKVFFEYQWGEVRKVVRNLFSGGLQNDGFNSFSIFPKASMDIHPSVRIPDRLLRGPLGGTELKLLMWLALQGAEPAEDQTWETTRNFIWDLITENHIRPEMKLTTIFVFSKLGVFRTWPKEEARHMQYAIVKTFGPRPDDKLRTHDDDEKWWVKGLMDLYP